MCVAFCWIGEIFVEEILLTLIGPAGYTVRHTVE